MEKLTIEVSRMAGNDRIPQRDELKDLCSIVIDTDLPIEERVRSFVQQIGDPYHYRVGDVVVTVSYTSNHGTLTDRFSEMLSLME